MPGSICESVTSADLPSGGISVHMSEVYFSMTPFKIVTFNYDI